MSFIPGFTVSRGDRNALWVAKYCRDLRTGGPVKLTPAQRERVRAVYTGLERPAPIMFEPDLAAFLSLCHLLGPESLLGQPVPNFGASCDDIWCAASPALCECLQRDDGMIFCRSLGTCFSEKIPECLH
jgi:hypothetical protein